MTGEDICPDCGYDEGEHETECPIGSGHSREWWALLRRCERDPGWAVEQIVGLEARLKALSDALKGVDFDVQPDFDQAHDLGLPKGQWNYIDVRGPDHEPLFMHERAWEICLALRKIVEPVK